MDDLRASTQDIRPLKILILNLMPLKITTETDLIRLLSNSPLQIEIEFLGLSSHTPKNTPIEHLLSFYTSFSKIKDAYYDGMIITGAPVEMLPFEEVNYWDEVTEIYDWRARMSPQPFTSAGQLSLLYTIFTVSINIPWKKAVWRFHTSGE